MTPEQRWALFDVSAEDMPARIAVRERLFERSEWVDGCLAWRGARNENGYPQIRIKGKLRRAHRVAYEEFIGPIPEGYELDHLCRMRACIWPDHLEPVTHLENMRRAGNGHRRKTHCPKGHPYAGQNLEERRQCGGRYRHRQCRTCKREQWRQYYWRRKARQTVSR